MMRFPMAAVCALAICPMPAQQVWLVSSCTAPAPVHFADLPAAVAAAAPGDEIRLIGDSTAVCSGSAFYLPAIIDKPLTIVGIGGSGVPQVWQDATTIVGLLQITGLQPGERVVLRGISIINPNGIFASGPAFGIDAMNCAGDIILDRVNVWANSNGGATARFVDCANVVAHDCEFVMGESPVLITNSIALFTNSLIRHNPPWLINSPTFTNNSYGLHLTNATASLVASVVRGGDQFSSPQHSWGAKPAAYLDHSGLNVGPGTLLIGGGFPQSTVSYLMAGSGNEYVHLDPRGVIDQVPGGLNNSPPVPMELPATMYDDAAPGETFEYRIVGPSGGYAVLAIGNYLSPALPTVFGGLSLDPATMTAIGCHYLGSGEFLGTLAVPLGIGSPFVYGLQSLTLSPSSEFGLTSATTFVLGWQSNLSPY